MNAETTETNQSENRAASKKEVALFFQVKTRTIDNWIRQKRIPYWKIGRTVRFDIPAIRARLNAGK